MHNPFIYDEYVLIFLSFQDYDYYDRYDDRSDLFERRYSSMGGSSRSRDFMPLGRRDPMPLPPSLGGRSSGLGSSLRGSSNSSNFDRELDRSVFSRRTPPRSGNGMDRYR